jgi:hypothetical protein
MREALPAFGRKIKGFDMPDALLTGVETRTSSPLKIPRGDNLQSTNVAGLYPAGEGASYAGRHFVRRGGRHQSGRGHCQEFAGLKQVFSPQNLRPTSCTGKPLVENPE